MGSHHAQIPTSFGKELRACLRCTLVKTYSQFTDAGCENCPFFNMDQDNDRVLECTTPQFAGIIASMEPTGSWAARWQRISKFAPGCYALSVTGALPEEMQEKGRFEECTCYKQVQTSGGLLIAVEPGNALYHRNLSDDLHRPPEKVVRIYQASKGRKIFLKAYGSVPSPEKEL